MKIIAKSKYEKNIRLLTYIFLLLFLFMNSLFRSSATIVMPLFMKQMNLSASFTGLIAGLFFFPNAVMQLFMGPLAKKYGAVRLLCCGIMLAIFGSLTFAFATTPYHLMAGRFLQGLGLSPVYVCLISFQQDTFNTNDYAKAIGIQLMVNNLGAACASAPLRFFLKKFGIRNLFLGIASVLILACISFLVLDSRTPKEEKNIEGNNSSVWKTLCKGVSVTFLSKILLACLIVRTIVNAELSTFQSLWGVKWTSLSFPDSLDNASLSVLVLSVGLMAGCLFSEKLRCKHYSREITVTILSILTLVLMILCTLIRHISINFVLCTIFDALIGVSVGHLCVQITGLVREVAKSDNSTVMGFMNFLSNFCSYGFQWLSGILIGLFGLALPENLSFDSTYIVFIIIFLLSVLHATSLIRKKQ